MCKIAVKYKYASRAVCAYTHIFQKPRGCALIGACAVIRTNTVNLKYQGLKKVKVFNHVNDDEMAQSEQKSHSKNRDGKMNQTPFPCTCSAELKDTDVMFKRQYLMIILNALHEHSK